MRRSSGAAILVIIGFASCASWCGGGGGDDTAPAEIAATDATNAPPKAVSATMLPHLPEDRGKFLEVCLDRPLGQRERYEIKTGFSTSNATQLECRDIVSGSDGPSCFRLNVFCFNRHTTAEQRRIMERDIFPGGVAELTVTIAKTYDATFASTHTFRDL